jgi:hypothetical protein
VQGCSNTVQALSATGWLLLCAPAAGPAGQGQPIKAPGPAHRAATPSYEYGRDGSQNSEKCSALSRCIMYQDPLHRLQLLCTVRP